MRAFCIGTVGDVCACSVYGCARVPRCVNWKLPNQDLQRDCTVFYYCFYCADAMDEIT